MDNFFCRVLLACIHRISYRRFWLRGSRRGGAPSERKNGQAPEHLFTGPARNCPLRRDAPTLGYRLSFGLDWIGIATLPARNMTQAYCQGTQHDTARAANQARRKGPVGGRGCNLRARYGGGARARSYREACRTRTIRLEFSRF